MTSKARNLADLGNVYDDGALSNRNLIINSAMQVAQRGTSEAGVTTSGYKTCDRWVFTVTNQGTWTVSQSSTTPNSDFSSSFKLDCTSADASPAASDQVAVTYRIEAQDVTHLGYGSSDAKSVTVSFWVRSSKTGTYTFEILANDPNRQISKTYTINTADTWEKKEITILGDAGGSGIVNDNGIGLILKWWLGAGSDFNGGTYTDNVWAAKVNANRASPSNVNLADSTSNDWYITGVQLEVGDTATPFEHRSYGDELARCQRYYQRSISEDHVYTFFMDGQSRGSTNGELYTWFPTKMRAAPSLSTSAPSYFFCVYGSSVAAPTTIALSQSYKEGACVTVNPSGQTAGQAISLVSSNRLDAYVAFDAEL